MSWKRNTFSVLLSVVLIPGFSYASQKTWTGYGGDDLWSNPLNWSDESLPAINDDILLDNADLPVSYQIILPDQAIVVRTLNIFPSPGHNIEVILPPSNRIIEAFTATGPGYGIELNAGAVFRNSSGLNSGESLKISDSIIIHDGGRYIHQTRASHANSILKFMSTAPGTEQGVFEFNVPRASYTISVSNRIYGSLELNADANGSTVNYTCAGSNPLLIRGTLRIGKNVQMSMDLTGVNGNIQVDGDFIQQGGILNLATGANANTLLKVKGDLYQSPESVITESTNGNPYLELNGDRRQEIAFAGKVTNQVGFRLNNSSGAELRMPLKLPWSFNLQAGRLISSADFMLTLDSNCRMITDSTVLNNFVDGPLRKIGLMAEPDFLFPVGKEGNLRWVNLKKVTGNFTVEYMHTDPHSLGTVVGPGLDHVSGVEYWNLMTDSGEEGSAVVELSFSSALSGGVTDLAYLNVAQFQSGIWSDIGHTSFSGNSILGSVSSAPVNFRNSAFTLASQVNLENPLPLTIINLKVSQSDNAELFIWTIETSETPDHFELYEEINGIPILVTEILADYGKLIYSWRDTQSPTYGRHFYRVKMIDTQGNDYLSPIAVLENENSEELNIKWISAGSVQEKDRFLIRSKTINRLDYEIFSSAGACVKKGSLLLPMQNSFFAPGSLIAGLYVFVARDMSGKIWRLPFMKTN